MTASIKNIDAQSLRIPSREPDDLPRAESVDANSPLLARIVDALPGAVGYIDDRQVIVYANALAAQWYARCVDALIGERASFLLGHGRETTAEAIMERLGEAMPVREEREIRFPDGSMRVVFMEFLPDHVGERFAGHVFQLRDVTYRRRTEETLRSENRQLDLSVREATFELRRRNLALKKENAARRRSEERYRIVSELMSDLIYVYHIDADGKMRTVWFTGRLSKEFAPQLTEGGHYRVWRPIIHPDDEVILDQRIERLMGNRTSVDEFRVIDREGMTRWLRVFGRPIFDEERGQVTRIMVAAQDITETKVAERQLEQHRYMLSEALASMSDGFMLFDSRGKLVEFNEKVRALFPVSASSIVRGARFESILRRGVYSGEIKTSSVDPEQWIQARLQEFPCDHGAQEFELANGRWILATNRPTGDGGVVAIRTDISERKHADEQRRQHEAELAQLLRRASMGEMASALAHELGQPLAVIVNYASGLLRRFEAGEVDAESTRAALMSVRDSGQRAKEILRHVGDFVRLRSPEVRPESMRLIVREVVDMLDGALVHNAITLSTSLPPEALRVAVNRIEIEQVLFNLLRNGIDAINSSDPDVRRIELTCTPDGNGFCEVCVSDTGPGVDDKVKGSLFEPYITTKAHGLGMGLSISRTIIEAHGGRLWVEATDRGALFRFRLPVTNDGQTD